MSEDVERIYDVVGVPECPHLWKSPYWRRPNQENIEPKVSEYFMRKRSFFRPSLAAGRVVKGLKGVLDHDATSLRQEEAHSACFGQRHHQTIVRYRVYEAGNKEGKDDIRISRYDRASLET